MSAENPSFFLIDDDEDDREIFKLALNKIDPAIEFHAAKDGFIAIEKFNSEPGFKPDFIFLDLNMPKMNGKQCLGEIKSNPKIDDIPVFIYTTSSNPEEEKKLIAAGASAFVVKPFDIYDLISLLKKIINRK